jgi:RNA-binding protein 26
VLSCDADPGALADYVAALLERDAPESELRAQLNAELDDFLEKGMRPRR